MPKGRPKGFNEDTVLEKAMQTFWREGYSGASMSVLLKDMGISRQSLYDTYGDKRTLFLKTLKLYISRDVDQVVSILSGPPPVRPQILQIIAHFKTMSSSDEPRGCFIVNSLTNMKDDDPELASILNDAIESIRNAMEKAFASAIQRGEMESHQSSSELANGLLNSLIGLAATSKANSMSLNTEHTVSFISNMMLPPAKSA